jgi:hypothetical protein
MNTCRAILLLIVFGAADVCTAAAAALLSDET